MLMNPRLRCPKWCLPWWFEEEDSSIEIVISGKEMKRDQAEGTGTEPVPEDAMLKKEGQVVETGEPVLDVDRSREEPDLMEIDTVVRTGDVPVREVMRREQGLSLFLRRL